MNYPVPRFFICSAEQLCPFTLSCFSCFSGRVALLSKSNSPLRLLLRSVPVERILAGISWYYGHFCNLVEFTEVQQGVLLFMRLAGNTNLHNTFVVLARVPCGGQAYGAIIQVKKSLSYYSPHLRHSVPVVRRQFSGYRICGSRACWVSSTGTDIPEPIRANTEYQLTPALLIVSHCCRCPQLH